MSENSGLETVEPQKRKSTAYAPYEKPVQEFGARTVIQGNGSSSPDQAPAKKNEQSFDSTILDRLFPASSTGDSRLQTPVRDIENVRLDHFIVEQRIGSGGMGAVFRAHDSDLDRTIALKVLSPSFSHDESAVKRFVNEARSAAKLDHENIAKVYYIGEDLGLHFIAFEYVDGINIQKLMRDKQALTVSQALDYAWQVAAAIEHTSEHEVVHRDIKPSNIIVKENGRAKLVDWGLARINATDVDDHNLTQAGTTLGTFDYISPEQAKDPRKVDTRSDIYSLGCTLFHMLTGEPPYPEGTVTQKLLSHQDKDVPSVHERNPEVPKAVSACVRKMMHPNPERRYRSGAEVMQAIETAALNTGHSFRDYPSVILEENSQRFSARFYKISVLVPLAMLIFAIVAFEAYVRFRGGGNSVDQMAVASVDRTNSVSDGKSTDTDPRRIVKELQKANPDPLDLESIDLVNDLNRYFPPTFSQVPVVPPLLTSIDLVNSFQLEASPGDSVQIADTKSDDSNGGNKATDTQNEWTLTQADSNTTEAEQFPERSTSDSEESSVAEGNQATLAQYTVYGPDTLEPVTYNTLEEAVEAAPKACKIEVSAPFSTEQNPVIVSTLNVGNKDLLIQGDKNHRPVLRFISNHSLMESAMISIAKGSLHLADMDISTNVIRQASDDQWAFISAISPGEIIFERIRFKMRDSGETRSCIVHLNVKPVLNTMRFENRLEDMEAKIDMHDSIFLGQVDFLRTHPAIAVQLDINDSAIALEGALIDSRSEKLLTYSSTGIDVALKASTLITGEGLALVDAGTSESPSAPLNFEVFSCILETDENPLFTLHGEKTLDELERIVSWKGNRNQYLGVTTFEELTRDSGGGSEIRTINFEQWQKLWSLQTSELNRIRHSQTRPTDLLEMRLPHFQFIHDGYDNPAMFDAGVKARLFEAWVTD